jgi:hypothetical protein
MACSGVGSTATERARIVPVNVPATFSGVNVALPDATAVHRAFLRRCTDPLRQHKHGMLGFKNVGVSGSYCINPDKDACGTPVQ